MIAPLPQLSENDRLARAWARFDEENSRDPNPVLVQGRPRPRELAYAEWLTDWVLRLAPQASEALLLAARSQHLCRWLRPRSDFPATRAGYLQWRAELKHFHADRTASILHEIGYPDELIDRVRSLNLKQNLAADAECQVLEDALCLVTLQYQFSELLEKTGPEKLVSIVQRTWRKMSSAAHAEALLLPFGEREKSVIVQALDASST